MSVSQITSPLGVEPVSRRGQRALLAGAISAFAVVLVLFVSLRQAALFLVGCGLGAVLARTRFGFTTGWRQLVRDRDPRGAAGQIALLALAAVLAMPLLGRFSELQAALGPPSVALLVGAFVFGMTMQIADGCGSGTLYKAGLGVRSTSASCRSLRWAAFWDRCIWSTGWRLAQANPWVWWMRLALHRRLR